MAEPNRKRGRPRSTTEGSGTIQALERGLDILDLLAASNGLTLTQIAERTTQPPSTVHRVLTTLSARGIAESDPVTQSWHIGPATFRLGSAFMRRSGIVERARPVLRRLMEATGETANLGILNGDAVLFVSQAETHETIRAFFPPGTRSPLHASGIGKALLAYGDEDTLRRLLDGRPLQRFTDRTITTADDLRADLARIRARSFSVDDEERTAGMRCIAAPVFDMMGAAVAGVSVSGPTHRVAEHHIKTLGAAVIEAGRDLTEALGGQAAQPAPGAA